jgi:hypothetical protein
VFTVALVVNKVEFETGNFSLAEYYDTNWKKTVIRRHIIFATTSLHGVLSLVVVVPIVVVSSGSLVEWCERVVLNNNSCTEQT